ncbi:MAG: Eco57I restriction-modification methylase domain-containing protein [Solirubrobacteraceae bacterium]
MPPVVADLLRHVEQRRRAVSAELSARHRATLGQFFTPRPAADFLASLVELPAMGRLRLLDPGAGVGTLSAAVAARVVEERPGLELHITAFELDDALVGHLRATLEECVAFGREHGCSIAFEIRHQSFVEYATGWGFETPGEFDVVIANPPYRKVGTRSPECVSAATAGLRAGNLYTIFTGLASSLLADDGQLSVIIPRSWANGPYHEPFRRFLLDRLSLDHLHVYEQRGNVFADAEVLQENVVLSASRRKQSKTVTLSTSTGGDDAPVARDVPVEQVLRPGDPHVFVRIPTDERATRIAEQMAELPADLTDIGAEVSTGRVVDFRSRESLREHPAADTVPLVHPGHVRRGRVVWPAPGAKKPNALHRTEATESLLLPNEPYVLVKRFSAKEERRRVVAAVSDPDDLPGDAVAYENHLNVYHRAGRGLPLLLALGLSAYLNCTLVDDYVRSFSGHTQINATDLRQLRYPRTEDLVRLGGALSAQAWPGQDELDALVAEYVPAVSEPPGDLAEAA